MNTEETPLFHTVTQACHRLALGRSKLYQLIQGGQITPVRVGRRTLLSERELQRFHDELVDETSNTKVGGA